MFYPNEKIALFIDGANLYATARALDFDIDYKKLLELFRTKGTLVRAYYYTVLIEDQEYSPIRPLVDWLDYNGYTLVTKPARDFTDSNGRRRIRNSIDVDLAVDMMELAGKVDHVVLFSGDGGYRRLVEAAQRQGVRVTVISTISSNPPMAADELRRQADNFLDIAKLKSEIARDRPNRPRRAQAEDDEFYDEEFEDDDEEFEDDDDFEDDEEEFEDDDDAKAVVTRS